MAGDKSIENMTREELQDEILRIQLENIQAKFERLYRAGILERPEQ